MKNSLLELHGIFLIGFVEFKKTSNLDLGLL